MTQIDFMIYIFELCISDIHISEYLFRVLSHIPQHLEGQQQRGAYVYAKEERLKPFKNENKG